MAINTSGKPLRHVSTFTSSGNWVTPAGVNSVFVSVNGASGGGGGSGGSGYSFSSSFSGQSGGNGVVAGAWIQVNPGETNAIVIGAAGSAGSGGSGRYTAGNPGSVGGTTTFNTTLFSVAGGAGGGGGGTGAQGQAAAGSASSSGLDLSALSPSPNALRRVSSITSQATGATAGGAAPNSIGPRYTHSTGSVGQAAALHIYI
jgi:hypothetical protein